MEKKKSILSLKLDEIDNKNRNIRDSLIKIPDEDLEELNKRTLNDILETDPEPVLKFMFDRVIYKYGQYKISRRAEDSNPSCVVSLKNGKWGYYDFGDSSSKKSGNIINLLTERGLDYKGAVSLCVSYMGLTDYGAEKLEEVVSLNKIILDSAKLEQRAEYKSNLAKSIEETFKKAEEKAKESKEKNTVLEKEQQRFTRVSYASKTIPLEYIKMLHERGIEHIPNWMYYIKGEVFKNSNNGIVKTSTIDGVGVLTTNEENLAFFNKVIQEINSKGYIHLKDPLNDVKIGGDVHIIPYINKDGVKIKTKSFGIGGITPIVPKNPNDKIFIAESKMDGAIASNIFNLEAKGVTLLLANSINNTKEISNFIKKEQEQRKVSIYHLNQNDISAMEFTTKINEECNLKNFVFLDYKKEEYKKDVNDLFMDDVSISSRMKIGNNTLYKNQVLQAKEFLKQSNKLNPLEEKKIDKILEILNDSKESTNENEIKTIRQIDNKKEGVNRGLRKIR